MSDIISFFLAILFGINSIFGAPIFFKVKIVTEPAVFECGNGNYCVIWETNRKSNGYVTIEKDGEEYCFYDSDYGIVRTDDTVHSVKLPKALLDNATYTCHSQYIFRQYSYLVNLGPIAHSKPIEFTGYHGQETVKALVLSDVHEKWDQAKDAMKNFGNTSWDMIILNGDISNTVSSKENFVEHIIAGAHELSGGRIPVVFNRGNHEAMGKYSPDMQRYFKTEAQGLYYTFSYGNIDFVSLDAGADKLDDHEVFNGLVDFKEYIAVEEQWLKALQPNENDNLQICICHQPHYSDYENNWAAELNRLGISLVISGHWHVLNDNISVKGAQYRTVVAGGKQNKEENTFIATAVTFNADKTVHMLSYDNHGVCRYDGQIV